MFRNPFKPADNWDNPVNHNLSDYSRTSEEDSSVLFTGVPRPLAIALLAVGMLGQSLKDRFFPPKGYEGINYKSSSIRDLGPNKDINEL